ncbi:MAG: HlyD family efflux transporter periplasmic adaptor subunit [Salinivirgaceae bacterium]|jgi:HlyD family secretion protein|nr:HlyD family efflux transporter periplasmic adaptor subunit [Salinivirgaceae bacterium]
MDTTIEKKRGIKKKHIFYALGIGIFIYVIFNIFFTDHVQTLRVSSDRLTVNTVVKDQFNDYIRITGQVEPISTIFLDAEEGGRVKERLIDEGAMVKKGDVIIKLENRTLHQEIMNSESNLAQKENMLRQTRINFQNQMIETQRSLLESRFDIIKKKRNYEQQKALFEEKLVAKEEYLRAEEDYKYSREMQKINRRKANNDSLIMITEMKQLDVDLEKMRLTLELVYERLDNLNVKAPVAGQLGMLDAEIGQSIGRGTRIGQINVLTNYKVEAQIDEHYIDRVRRDLTATLDRNGTNYNLRIKKVYPEVRSGQFKIDLIFTDERPENIRTGQSYQINLQLGQPDEAILLARGGFFQSTGGQWAYVLDPTESFATKRSIRIGKQNPKYYEILEGLQPGEKVITSGYESFGENDKLIISN